VRFTFARYMSMLFQHRYQLSVGISAIATTTADLWTDMSTVTSIAANVLMFDRRDQSQPEVCSFDADLIMNKLHCVVVLIIASETDAPLPPCE